MAFHTATRSPTRSPTYSPTAWKWESSGGYVNTGDAILDTLQVETDGLVIDGLLNRTLVRTASVDSASTPNALLTYTAPSAKYVMNNAATLVSASTIRTEYNAAGTAQGIRIEEARTNICLQSEDFTTTWANSNSTETSNSIAAPDGTTTADTITASAGNAVHGIFQSGPVGTTAVNYAVSVFVKKGTHRYVALSCNHAAEDFVCAVFDLDGVTGAATETDVGTTSGTIASTSQTSMGNGWYRLVVVGSWTGTGKTPSIGFATAATGNSFGTFGNITFNAAGTETFYLWGAQVELGSFATSYIKTVAATVTRAADQISLATSAFPWSATAGSVICAYNQLEPLAAERTIWTIGQAAASNFRFVLRNDTADPYFYVVDSGATQAGIDAGTAAANVVNKSAVAWAANDFAHSFNGGAAGTDGAGTIPNVDTLYLAFSARVQERNTVYIRTFCYRPRRITNANVVTEST
jgi:hypothetical protein